MLLWTALGNTVLNTPTKYNKTMLKVRANYYSLCNFYRYFLVYSVLQVYMADIYYVHLVHRCTPYQTLFIPIPYPFHWQVFPGKTKNVFIVIWVKPEKFVFWVFPRSWGWIFRGYSIWQNTEKVSKKSPDSVRKVYGHSLRVLCAVFGYTRDELGKSLGGLWAISGQIQANSGWSTEGAETTRCIKCTRNTPTTNTRGVHLQHIVFSWNYALYRTNG